MNSLADRTEQNTSENVSGRATLFEFIIIIAMTFMMIVGAMVLHRHIFPWGYEKLDKGEVVTLPILGEATVTHVPDGSKIFIVEGTDAEGRTHTFPLTREAAYNLRIKKDVP